MNLFGINQVGTGKSNTERYTNKKLPLKVDLISRESAVLELGNPDLRGSGVYSPERGRKINQQEQSVVYGVKAETLRSIVERIVYKQALSKNVEEYWNAESTSQRVIELAKALSDDDQKSVEQIRAGFIQGFQDARELLGEGLPQVCHDTYNLIIAIFDSWMGKGS